jgi:hypothetical protein
MAACSRIGMNGCSGSGSAAVDAARIHSTPSCCCWSNRTSCLLALENTMMIAPGQCIGDLCVPVVSSVIPPSVRLYLSLSPFIFVFILCACVHVSVYMRRLCMCVCMRRDPRRRRWPKHTRPPGSSLFALRLSKATGPFRS